MGEETDNKAQIFTPFLRGYSGRTDGKGKKLFGRRHIFTVPSFKGGKVGDDGKKPKESSTKRKRRRPPTPPLPAQISAGARRGGEGGIGWMDRGRSPSPPSENQPYLSHANPSPFLSLSPSGRGRSGNGNFSLPENRGNCIFPRILDVFHTSFECGASFSLACSAKRYFMCKKFRELFAFLRTGEAMLQKLVSAKGSEYY